ncbi:MAG: rod shape-determining protein MreD [Acidobacteria bacterium]|nr:rod shape-determining protein MreD [Acidobacteriota bacterium]
MEGVRLTIALIVAVALQWTLRNVFEPLMYIDLPLIVIVYAAVGRNTMRALIFGTAAGLAVDALSGGLLGAGAFAKTLVAYIVSEIARRVYLDNVLLRIPVLAGACIFDDLAVYVLHNMFGQPPVGDLLITAAYSLIGTTVVGTMIFLLLQSFSGTTPRKRKSDFFPPRRNTRRRNPIRLGK